jgi:hypothetical protein
MGRRSQSLSSLRHQARSIMIVLVVCCFERPVEWRSQIVMRGRVGEYIDVASLFSVKINPMQPKPTPYSLDLSATSQQYFSLTTNQPPATSQQYSSLRINQHQPSATSHVPFNLFAPVHSPMRPRRRPLLVSRTLPAPVHMRHRVL